MKATTKVEEKGEEVTTVTVSQANHQVNKKLTKMKLEKVKVKKSENKKVTVSQANHQVS